MKYLKLEKENMCNGEGVRVVLWLSGCSHNCKGCHNPQTHNPNSGILFDENAKGELFEALEKSYILGITFSGGDPLHENNLQEVLNLIKEIKNTFPEKTVWLYSGYTYEQCLDNPVRKEIVSKCDVFVDGRYEADKRDITLKWCGSSNQRVIDVQKSIKDNKLALFCQ